MTPEPKPPGAPGGRGAPGAPGAPPGRIPPGPLGRAIGSRWPTSAYSRPWTRASSPRFGCSGSGSGSGRGAGAGAATFSPVHSRNAPQDPQNESAPLFLKPHDLQTIM
ncbi:hypothetical protein [Spirilliplanes yamanashiensis]|uniref:Uncharacterized protein n=1 Tax=Spirilliplanes yamanashiensis TaxID=42233 RepID=A0A8J3Y8Y1_9ACTN|nr:hypothetical protein [Spirilliplanes yamanashiensis]MDP9815440.1 hypothetical protein [Spirilliplanes yamanashiensis]GIJ03695.1 hypothetical protein Sya03_30470 [Spirilliplanes yamanashiensis]